MLMKEQKEIINKLPDGMIIHQTQEDPELKIESKVNIKFINQTLKKMILCHLIDESSMASQHLSNQYSLNQTYSVQG